MSLSRPGKLSIIIAIVACLQFTACSSADLNDPRQVVITMFGAMEKNDQATLAHILDLAELMKDTGSDYALQGSTARVFTNPKDILDDLTDSGLTKQRWFSMQRIVNKAENMGETALVEVTFVDKESSKGYLTKFGLKKIHGKWKIYSFKTSNSAS